MSWEVKNSGVRLDSYLEDKINEFAQQLAFDIVITDGNRSPREQVDRMYAKLDATPPEDLRNVYLNDQFADEVMEAYPNIDDGIAVVEKWMAISTPSDHLFDSAFDVRTYDKTSTQINQMIAVANNLDYKPFLESNHLHIGVPHQERKKNFLIAAALLGGLGLWISRK